MKIVTRFFYRDNEYIITKNDGFYMAINTQDLDKNGCLVRTMNGLQLFANRDLNNTLEQVKNHLDIIAYGFTSKDIENNTSLLFDIVTGKYRA